MLQSVGWQRAGHDWETELTNWITTIWYWQETDTDQQNRTESSEMNPQLYKQLIYDKRGKTTLCGQDCPFNKQCWENWTATCRRIKLDYSLIPRTKIGLYLRHETKKLTEESTGSKLEHHTKRSHGNETPEHHNYKAAPGQARCNQRKPSWATKTQHPQKQASNFQNTLYGKTKEL